MRSICAKLLTLWKWKWKRDTWNSGDIPFLDCSLLKSWEGMHAKDNKGYLPANSKMDTENWWCGDVHFKGPDGFRSWIRNFRRFHGSYFWFQPCFPFQVVNWRCCSKRIQHVKFAQLLPSLYTLCVKHQQQTHRIHQRHLIIWRWSCRTCKGIYIRNLVPGAN